MTRLYLPKMAPHSFTNLLAADLLDAQAAIDWAVDQQSVIAKRITDWAGTYSTGIAVEDARKA
jgi:hypothetical protein